MNRYLLAVFSILLLSALLFSGCGKSPGSSSASTKPASSAAVVPAEPRGVTGTITTGKSTSAASQKISSGGGTISVTGADSPIKGLQITVPSGAYQDSTNFKISSAPVEKHTFGDGFNPITPLITVDNGGGYSEKIMSIKVPVQVPEDSFAMGFYYDAGTKKLTGMNLLAQDASSVTVGARHFSSFIISMIPQAKLKKDIDSGFRPGIDDWQFVNYGSYIEQGGHCAGQSLTALWYYCNQPDGKDLTLNGRYDNYGSQPPTPDFWKDDSRAYRFASSVQNDVNWGSFQNLFLANLAGVNDELTWNMFAYSMQLTGEPQEVGIFSKAGGGHDMICYRIKDGNLYIADPNYPGNTQRKIEYQDGQFAPYNSGANANEIAAGRGKAYEEIEYCAKTTTVSWDKIAQRWQEFKSGTIGSDKFPSYQITWRDDQGVDQELKDGYVSPVKLININVQVNNLASGQTSSTGVYRDGKALPWDSTGNYELSPGENKLGIWVTASVPFVDKNGNTVKVDEYIDFKYLTVTYTESGLTIDPKSLDGKMGEEYTFTARVDVPIKGATYEWLIDGQSMQKSTGLTFQTQFTSDGQHTVQVNQNSGAKLLKTAQAVVNIAAASPTPSPSNSPSPTPESKLSILQKLNAISANYSGTFSIERATYAGSSVSEELSRGGIPYVGGSEPRYIKITWDGTSFSGEYKTDTSLHTVTGTVSADGNRINNVDYSYTYTSSSTDYGTTTKIDEEMVLKLKNIPLDGDAVAFSIYGSDVQKYIDEFSSHKITYQNGSMNTEATYLSTNWEQTGSSSKPALSLDFSTKP